MLPLRMLQRRQSPTSAHCLTSTSFRGRLKRPGDWLAAVDKYIVENEPWALDEKKDEESRARLATVLYTSAEALRIVTALAHPVMPDATAKIWAQMGWETSRNST